MTCDRLGTIFLSIGIIIGALVLRNGILGFKQLDNTIEVRGLDERDVKSDETTWQIRYVVSADEIKKLYVAGSDTSTAIVSFLNEKGFTKEEIQKTPLVISDGEAQNYGSNARQLRFSGRASVIVTTKKVDLVTSSTEATDSLIEKGVILEGSEVRYYFTALNKIKPEMLKNASQAATAAATSLANDTGVKLGKIKNISQGLFSIASPYTDSEYDASSSLMKRVRVVTRAEYSID